jgi:hypothetical protein
MATTQDRTLELPKVGCSNLAWSTLTPAQTAKRDFLIELETRYQNEWQTANVFHTDAPHDDKFADLSPDEVRAQLPKWMGTFPYPYMNGSLHLGHAFTISKIEFNSGYQRMLGKRALFPMAFHCTGMPIKVAPLCFPSSSPLIHLPGCRGQARSGDRNVRRRL